MGGHALMMVQDAHAQRTSTVLDEVFSPMRLQNAMVRFAAQLERTLQSGGKIADLERADHIFASLGTNNLWR